MPAVKIADNVYSVGVVDWNVRVFHGHTYKINRGTSYNAYLIIGEKIALVDTVHKDFKDELIENICQVIDPCKIDYIVANHVEMDHSGSIPYMLDICPNAVVVGTEKCKQGLYKHYYTDMKFNTVKTGDTLELGGKTLTFVEAPMLHWPDSMFTYVNEDAILMSNDAFGQHYAASKTFNDEINTCELDDESAKYYGNILWPFSNLVLRKIDELKKLNIPVKMIAPSHGVIWRKNPETIIDSYVKWASNEPKEKVVIVYETMWGSTALMARKILEGIVSKNIEVKIYDINSSDRTEIIKEMLDAKGFIIGSSTHDNDMLSSIAGFLDFLKGLKPKNRFAAVFGSYGWGGGAVKNIEKILTGAGIELKVPSLSVQYVPSQDELKKCYEFGINIVKEFIER